MRTLSTSSTAIFSTVCSVSSRLVIERRIGGDFLRYTKKQKRYLLSEYTSSWKKLACIITVGMLQQVLRQIRSPTRCTIHCLANGICCLVGRQRGYTAGYYATTQMLIRLSESLGLQIYKNLDMLVLLLDQRFKAILNNAIDLDLAGNHLLRLHGSSAQSLNHTFIIIPLIAQY